MHAYALSAESWNLTDGTPDSGGRIGIFVFAMPIRYGEDCEEIIGGLERPVNPHFLNAPPQDACLYGQFHIQRQAVEETPRALWWDSFVGWPYL